MDVLLDIAGKNPCGELTLTPFVAMNVDFSFLKSAAQFTAIRVAAQGMIVVRGLVITINPVLLIAGKCVDMRLQFVYIPGFTDWYGWAK